MSIACSSASKSESRPIVAPPSQHNDDGYGSALSKSTVVSCSCSMARSHSFCSQCSACASLMLHRRAARGGGGGKVHGGLLLQQPHHRSISEVGSSATSLAVRDLQRKLDEERRKSDSLREEVKRLAESQRLLEALILRTSSTGGGDSR